MPKIVLLIIVSVYITACTTTTESEFGEIEWYVVNSSGGPMRVVVFDKLCNRTHFRVDLPRTGDVTLSTCQDARGRSEIRYRRHGRITQQNPWRDTIMVAGQALYINR